jgi:hypothetical protein
VVADSNPRHVVYERESILFQTASFFPAGVKMGKFITGCPPYSPYMEDLEALFR